MRKHMTNGDKLRIIKLLRSGVTEMEEIQKVVFIHEDRIKEVAKAYKDEIQAGQKEAKAAAAKAAKEAKAKKDVDPIS